MVAFIVVRAEVEAVHSRAAGLAPELRVLVGRLQRRLREQGQVGDFTGSQLAVLRRLEAEGAATVTALARAEGMRPQSMGANVAVLEAAGLVAGSPDPSDGRQTILALTPKCREWILSSRAAREDWLFHALEAELSAEELEVVSQAVELLKRLVNS